MKTKKQLANIHDIKSEHFIKLKIIIATLTISLLAIGPSQRAEACTRLVYETGGGTNITARGMDWNDPKAPTALWVYPRGMLQNGGVGKNPVRWTSKYGSVFVSFYPGNADGMNEKGLVGNVLYLAESDFGDAAKTGKPTLSIGAWNQYFLDNYATVAEAVAAMKDPPFSVVAPVLPNGRAANVHLSISDPTGSCLVRSMPQIALCAWTTS
jgi:choloylglycine hydrolase